MVYVQFYIQIVVMLRNNLVFKLGFFCLFFLQIGLYKSIINNHLESIKYLMALPNSNLIFFYLFHSGR